jgi:HD-like signal output (HDOD) protein
LRADADPLGSVSALQGGPVGANSATTARASGFQTAAGTLKFLIQTPINNQDIKPGNKHLIHYGATAGQSMGIIQKIRRHAAVAGGDFGVMFKGAEIPPLPLAVNRLLTELGKDNPDSDLLVRLISSETAIAAKVLQTVNSAFFGLRAPVTDIARAVALLGLKNVRNLALAYGTMAALPNPDGTLFDHEAFWNDSLLRAHLARCFGQIMLPGQGDEAFTAALLADIAIPVLLSVWSEYYAPVVHEWLGSSKHLSQIEREHFGWDHAQAGAWMVRSWRFPDEIVCYVGAHTLSMADIETCELEETLAVPIAIATRCASVLRPDAARLVELYRWATDRLDLPDQVFVDHINTIRSSFDEIIALFDVPNRGSDALLEQLATNAGFQSEDVTS